MARDDLCAGSIIFYPYLWKWQADRGETEGRKERETVIATNFRIANEDLLALLPVTSRAPEKGVAAYELPALEVQRLQRGAPGRPWIILNEMNIDRASGSFYITPDCKRGQLSRAAYRALYEAFVAALPRAARVRRSD